MINNFIRIISSQDLLTIIIWGTAKDQLILKTYDKEKFSSELCRQDSIPQLKSAILGISRDWKPVSLQTFFWPAGLRLLYGFNSF